MPQEHWVTECKDLIPAATVQTPSLAEKASTWGLCPRLDHEAPGEAAKSRNGMQHGQPSLNAEIRGEPLAHHMIDQFQEKDRKKERERKLRFCKLLPKRTIQFNTELTERPWIAKMKFFYQQQKWVGVKRLETQLVLVMDSYSLCT